MRLSSRNPLMRLMAFIVAVVVIGVAWYLISPLFIDMEVNEGFPTLGYMPTRTARATEEANQQATQTAEALGFDPAEATAMMEAAMTAEPIQSNDPMPDNAGVDMLILAQGDFYDIAHHGEGTATIYQLQDGARILRFEDFEVLNGPDLHVYLAPQDPVPDTVGSELAGALDLGALKGNVGDQNYEIPADLDLAAYRSVVIWCAPFRVPFSAAPLAAP